ncbi:hypothetical protein TRFO_02302 [Tritrichomonas foetus]|uniref:Uncharacterized protein n=1 Tax=Tritrichomonas foetus TaxID=1144522 RepID=A0A1J4J802_9EUKA|nr:hypothetical protein TRFO_02302 [Tritrichomonas foetus]|eukprot:OHS93795.1 hypothetical protein TRFO_02302 [Tritrichomonas foetus]
MCWHFILHFMHNSSKEEKKNLWEEILITNLRKGNVDGLGGIFGLDGKKYATINYFHISEPTAKAIADLFLKCDKVDNDEYEIVNDEKEPPQNLRDLSFKRSMQDNKDCIMNNTLSIMSELFVIISLNSRILYATNDTHCMIAYRCQFTFVLLLFANYKDAIVKSFLYQKLGNQSSQTTNQREIIPPEKYGRVVIKIANELIYQGA